MNLLTIDNFNKVYTERQLFDNASFSVQEGEKIGIIGANGMGKSTLLKIIAGIEETDSGEVIKGRNVKIGYLPQTPCFEEGISILDATISEIDKDDSTLVANAKSMLNKLGLYDHDMKVEKLSGGQSKKVALVKALLLTVELLVLDEPTNHLDNEMSRWLEDYLISYKGAVVMVTHDRYFLDRVVDRIVELDHGKLYSYIGTYAEYVGLKMQRQNEMISAEKKRKNILRKELAWLARGARARSTKQKAHIQRIDEMLATNGPIEELQLEMSSVSSRIGKKTIEVNKLSKSYGDKVLIKDFSYNFLRNDKIGIVGPNGSGKSTFVKMIVGEITPDYGIIDIGETIKIGYFAQDNVHMDENMKAIDYVKEVAEYIDTPDGKITASALMERFLFDGAMQWSKIAKLSGGERRRLYLLRILISAPNVLIFDEPTNDLDIKTLNVLEDYLDGFDGIVIVVSHDRYFLDRVVNRVFAVEGAGVVKQYEGNHSDYLIKRALLQPDLYNEDGTLLLAGNKTEKKNNYKDWKKDSKTSKKIKFTYNEQREFASIDSDIASIEEKIEFVNSEMNKNATNSVKLRELMEELDKLNSDLEYKMDRWVYLNELNDMINNQ